jgi:formate C-acetyltransferase
VFDDKLISPAQLEHALATNFEDADTVPGGEEIRQLLINKAPKFGNDDPYVDDIAYEFIHFWGSSKMGFKNTLHGRGPIGGRFIPSTATVAANVPLGSICGATPDGRKAGDPISEGISAFGGSDLNGPTSLVNSISAIPNILMPGGQLLNVKFNTSTFNTPSGLKYFISLIRAFFAKKGFQMQVNVVDKSILLDAQSNPQNYRDLMIRVAGYSAYFISLNTDLQNDIIKRTEHSL